VFACPAAGGGQVVVKLAATPEEARLEAAALASWPHTGAAVRLIDADVSHGALLLERIRPGTPLPGGDDPVSVAAAARLLARLHLAAPGELPFPALDDSYLRRQSRARDDADYEQRARGDPARAAARLEPLQMARAAATNLCATTGRAVVLHGDFVDKNLLGPAPATWPSIRSLASATHARTPPSAMPDGAGLRQNGGTARVISGLPVT
jgi:streptomycin 6-kinase